MSSRVADPWNRCSIIPWSETKCAKSGSWEPLWQGDFSWVVVWWRGNEFSMVIVLGGNSVVMVAVGGWVGCLGWWWAALSNDATTITTTRRHHSRTAASNVSISSTFALSLFLNCNFTLCYLYLVPVITTFGQPPSLTLTSHEHHDFYDHSRVLQNSLTTSLRFPTSSWH